MKKVRPWCGQPSDLGRLKNRIGLGHVIDSVLFAFARGRLSRVHLSVCLIARRSVATVYVQSSAIVLRAECFLQRDAYNSAVYVPVFVRHCYSRNDSINRTGFRYCVTCRLTSTSNRSFLSVCFTSPLE